MRGTQRGFGLLWLFFFVVLLACAPLSRLVASPTPTPTWTPTPTATATPTSTPTPTATPTPEPTSTPTPLPTPTETPLPEVCYVTDVLESIEFQVPCNWEDFDPEPIVLDDIRIASIVAAPSLRAFDAFQGPGIWVMASRDIAKLGGFAQILESMRQAFYPDCRVLEKAVKYDDDYFRGQANVYGCGDVTVFHLVARPDTPDPYPPYLAIVIVHLTPDMEEDPVEVVANVLSTFDVNPRFLP